MMTMTMHDQDIDPTAVALKNLTNNQIIQHAISQNTAFIAITSKLSTEFTRIANERSTTIDYVRWEPRHNESIDLVFAGGFVANYLVVVPANDMPFEYGAELAMFKRFYWEEEANILKLTASEIINYYVDDSPVFNEYVTAVAKELSALADSTYAYSHAYSQTKHCITLQYSGKHGTFDIVVSAGMIIGDYKIFEWFSRFEGFVADNRLPEPELTVEERDPIELSTYAQVLNFDNCIWSGDAHYILSGDLCVVLHYLAETMMEGTYEQGQEVVKKAIQHLHKEITTIRFINA